MSPDDFYHSHSREYDPRYVSASFPPNWFMPDVVFRRAEEYRNTGRMEYITGRFLTGESFRVPAKEETELVSGWIPMRIDDDGQYIDSGCLVRDGTAQVYQTATVQFDVAMVDNHYIATQRKDIQP